MILSKLKIFWSYVKKYWGFAILILSVVLGTAFSFGARKEKTRLEDLIRENSEAHRKEVEQIRAARDQEIRQKQEIEKIYRETLDKIKREHSEAIEQLTKKKEQELQSIILQTKDDPELMANRINNLFGISIYHEEK